MPCEIQFTTDGLQDARQLPKAVRNNLAKELKTKLATDPLQCSEELREPLAGWRSFHSGKYRVIFKLYKELNVIAIAGIGKHSSQATQDIYRRLELLARKGHLAEDILGALRGFSGGKHHGTRPGTGVKPPHVKISFPWPPSPAEKP